MIQGSSKQILGASMFLMFACHCQERHPCLYRWILHFYHRVIKKDQYTPIAYGNTRLILPALAIPLGFLAISCDPSLTRRTDVALISLSKAAEILILRQAKVEHDQNSQLHPVLGDSNFSGFLLASAFTIGAYLHQANPKTLKAVEKKSSFYVIISLILFLVYSCVFCVGVGMDK